LAIVLSRPLKGLRKKRCIGHF